MSALLTVLSNILRLTSIPLSKQHPLQITPPHWILHDIFDQHASAPHIERFAEAVLAYAANGRETLAQLASLAAEVVSDHRLEAKLRRAAVALEEMLALHYLLRADAVVTGRLYITQAHFFDYLQCLLIEVPGQPPTLLVGQLVEGQPRLKLPLPQHRALLSHKKIAYEANDAYPLVSYELGSASRKDGWTSGREEWRQLDDSLYDLTIQLRRISGRIETRSPLLPYTLSNSRLSLTIGPTPGMTLHSTTVVDTTVVDAADEVLVRCLRAHASPGTKPT